MEYGARMERFTSGAHFADEKHDRVRATGRTFHIVTCHPDGDVQQAAGYPSEQLHHQRPSGSWKASGKLCANMTTKKAFPKRF